MNRVAEPRSDWASELVQDIADTPDIGVRILGGRAVRHHVVGKVPELLLRPPGDLDLFTNTSHRKQVQAWLESKGLVPEREFNILNGRRRLIYWMEQEKIDVFIDEFSMCHTIPLSSRLKLESVTIPIADLALTKLQIVEFTEKDMRDTLALLLGVPWHETDAPGVFNVAHFCQSLARDWGLWKTVTTNLEVVFQKCPVLLRAEDKFVREVQSRLHTLTQAIEDTPKTGKWKIRAMVGERVRWYELPEEP
ncbi:MAG: hypothetical protein K6T83_23505 [Alicyclobacillus sp.]|nr:hypothetical protein [Alicyclobacillus sp.]